MSRVVGVHGVGNYDWYRDNGRSAQRADAAISAAWSEWAGGPPAGLRVAYYAHHLHRGTPQGELDPAALEPGEQELLISWVGTLQPVPSLAQGPRTARARQAADWLTARFGRAARTFAMLFVREAHTYLSAPASPRRARARERVAEVIARESAEIVVAHSLGSVVAYEALWHRPDLRVGLLITVGSPLAMPGVVFDRLLPEPAARRGARPPGVARWVNLADTGDLVAVPRTGLAPRFEGVLDLDEVVIGDWDFHSVRNYLRCPEVRALIAGHHP